MWFPNDIKYIAGRSRPLKRLFSIRESFYIKERDFIMKVCTSIVFDEFLRKVSVNPAVEEFLGKPIPA